MHGGGAASLPLLTPEEAWDYHLRRRNALCDKSMGQSGSRERHPGLRHCCEVFIVMHWFVKLCVLLISTDMN